MCSIFGLFSRVGNIKDYHIERIQKANTILQNRGPEEFNYSIVSPNCIMAGNRLIIRGEKRQGSMPFVEKKSYCFYNGEIYNHSNFSNISYSDGEVILPEYLQLGISSFKALDGEFAISIWDEKKTSLILARDPFGTKPLYFSLSDDLVIYASSEAGINQIRQHSFCSFTKGAVFQHTLSIQEPYTSFNGIWMLPPGCVLIINNEQIRMVRYNTWKEQIVKKNDYETVNKVLESSLLSRLEYNGVIGIPMSGGIDSGIIAFTADKLNIKYEIFSVVEMFGSKTEETDAIYERINRLKNPLKVHLLKCNEQEISDALEDIYKPDYYCSEKYDTSAIPTHTVMKAMQKAGIKVSVDGSGGDELFNGYVFRNDFSEIDLFPNTWKNDLHYYSLYSTLLDYTAKVDRAGSHFSIETRFPYQNKWLMNAAAGVNCIKEGFSKSPLRNYLLTHTNYGKPLEIDINGKYGFSMKNIDNSKLIQEMKNKWMKINGLEELPLAKPKLFPFN